MIKFAVIGYGRIGRRHAEVIRCTANAQLVAVCDILSKEQVGLENIEVPYFRSIDELYEIPGLSEKTIKRFIDSVEVR